MNADNNTNREEMLALVDAEASKDRLFKRLGILGWSISMVSLVAFGIITFNKFQVYLHYAKERGVQGIEAWDSIVPFLAALGGIGLLIAVLAAVGMFIRMRTASMKQLSLRLANIEELVIRAASNQD